MNAPEVAIVVNQVLTPRVYDHPTGWKLTLTAPGWPTAITVAGPGPVLRATLLAAVAAIDEAEGGR